MTHAFLNLAHKYRAAAVLADSSDYPSFSDSTGDFVYARLMRSEAEFDAGYAPQALDRWAERARTWAEGGSPGDLPRIGEGTEGSQEGLGDESAAERTSGICAKPTDVFVFFIAGEKVRAPLAACALLQRLRDGPLFYVAAGGVVSD